MKSVFFVLALLLAVALSEEVRGNATDDRPHGGALANSTNGQVPKPVDFKNSTDGKKPKPDDGKNATDGKTPKPDDGKNATDGKKPKPDDDGHDDKNSTKIDDGKNSTKPDDDDDQHNKDNNGKSECASVRCRAPVCAVGEKLFKQDSSCCQSCQPMAVADNACKMTCREPKCPAGATTFKPDNACCASCRRSGDDSVDDNQFSNVTHTDGAASGSNCTSCATAGSDKKLKLKLSFKKNSFSAITTALTGDWQSVLSLAHDACRSHVRVLNITADTAASSLTLTYAIFDKNCAAQATPLSTTATIDTSAYTEDLPTVTESSIVAVPTTPPASSSASAVCVSAAVAVAAASALLL